jgi:phosphoglucomutase
MADGAWLCVRPSGTEPKVKFYYGVIGKSMEEAQELSKKFGEAVVNMIENML